MEIVSTDAVIREPLFEYLEGRYDKVRILEEMVTGRARADVVMILEDAVCGIEIKSDADTYARLAGQVRNYDLYYDRNLVVVGTKHAYHIGEHVPPYWGILTVEWDADHWDFYELRKPQNNPKRRWERKLSLLWRPELASLQEHYGMPKYKEKSRAFVIGKILEKVDVTDAAAEKELDLAVSDLLFERDYTTAAKTLAEYRKGEIDKKLALETDPKKQAELLMQKEKARKQFHRRKRRKSW